ncbi:rhomboid-like protein [Saccharothrix hoggarensis]|uniref:Rhomboid-like protein n=1 Tax=Saccharothrix hoggarensis TaxID=913853 RepID=A0ABW3QWB7_9PSEU
MRDHFRRNPATAGYLSAVAVLALLTRFVFADGMSAQVRESLSTNTDNLGHHPVNALLGSAFVLDTAGDGVIRTGLALVAVALCLGALEREVGSWRASAVALAGHVGAALVAALAVSSGAYPGDLSDVVDVGPGYVALAAAGSTTVLAPAVLRLPWVALLVAYPLAGARWFGVVPEFAAVGHVAAVLIGLCAGAFAVRRAYVAVGRL